MALAHDRVLVRYAELGLKAPRARARFEARLRANLERAFDRAGIPFVLEREQGRVFVETPEPHRAILVAQRVFGVASMSPVVTIDATLPAIAREAALYASQVVTGPGKSFAIRARREGIHPFSSRDVAVEAGDAVRVRLADERKEARVDLNQPDVELFVEVRNERAYLFHEKVNGPGGLPVGSEGLVVAVLEDEASLLAAWLVMRRGADVAPIAFGKLPTRLEQRLVALRDWGLARELTTETAEEEWVRKLERAKEAAERLRAEALVTGERGEAFDLLAVAQATLGFPVLRPLLGLDAAALQEFASRAGLPMPKGEE